MVAAFVTQEGLSLLRFLSSILRSLSEDAEDCFTPFILPGVVHPVPLWPDNDMGMQFSEWGWKFKGRRRYEWGASWVVTVGRSVPHAVQGLWVNLKFTTRFGPLSYLLYL